jgi:replicative DNA helicase
MTAIDGATFVLDSPESVPAIWGSASRPLWAQGEPLMIVGPDGVGKTTIAQQLALRRAGIAADGLLGYAVEQDARKVLYLAADRPRQVGRSMRRMVRKSDRDLLAQRFVFLTELPFDLLAEPKRLFELAREHDAGTVVIDSLKDIAPKLSDEATGDAIKQAMSACVLAGVEVLALHHQRKAQGDNKRPRTIHDIYGSRWITAGCGSILCLWGEAGDAIVELTHLKQPAEAVGPLTLQHDHDSGATSLLSATPDLGELLRASSTPLTAKSMAEMLFRPTGEATENDIAKARRRLKAAVREGVAQQLPTKPGEAALWAAAEGGLTGGCRGLTQGADGEVDAAPPLKGGQHNPVDVRGSHDGSEEGWDLPPDPDLDLVQLAIDGERVPLIASEQGALT